MKPCPGLLLLVLACLSTPPAGALELFGVPLDSASRDEIRGAAKNAGLVLIREGGEEEWFDLYDSSAVLEGSTRFYLGFVKKDRRFAFAEYEFAGLNHKALLQNLTRKYGPAEVRGGRFVSDHRYRWRKGGIRIELGSDWRNYRTRLIYSSPENLAALLAEKSARGETVDSTSQVSLY